MRSATNRNFAICFLVCVRFSSGLGFADKPNENSVERGSLPNIVILYADDLGYGDLGCMNPDSKIPAPSLDQLARDGIRFTDAHSSSGVCTPSRYALLTGRYHWRAFHDIVDSFGSERIKAEQLTLPEMLKGKGYRTACVGKWHLGWDWDAIKRPGAKPDPKNGYAPDDFDWNKPIPDGPLDHGFDYYFGDDVPNFPPYAWIENNRVVVAPTEPLTETPKTAEGNWEARPGPMVPDWKLDAVVPTITEKAIAWLENNAESAEPLFLYFPLTSPHAPIVPTDEYLGKSAAGGYGDFVVQTDAACGAVLDCIKRLGLEDNTLVIFSSDNGPEVYCYERLKKFGHRSMGPLRGIKRDVWEGGHRVPMIVKWPGTVPAGKTCERLVTQTDLFATIAEAIGSSLDDAQAEDSISQLPLLHDPDGNAIRKWTIHNTNKNRYALRDGDFLFLDGPDGDARKAPEWFANQEGWDKTEQPYALFNLADDLGQKKNLYAANQERAQEMQQRLSELLQRPGDVRQK